MRLRAALAILLLATVLVPTAAADHVYSHRLVMYGRVVDPSGHGVGGVKITARPVDYDPTGDCNDQPGTLTAAFGKTEMRAVTDPEGFFIVCQHNHAVDRAQGAHVVLRVEEAAQNFPVAFDPETRVAFVTLTLDRAGIGAANTTPTDYLVAGRVWRPTVARVALEGIPVYGETILREPVNVTVGGVTVAGQTNNYGDFAIRVPVANPTGDVTLRVKDMIFTQPVNATGWTGFQARLPLETPAVLFSLTSKGHPGGCWWLANGTGDPNPTLVVPPGADVHIILNAGTALTDQLLNVTQVGILGGFRSKVALGSDLLVNFTAPQSGKLEYRCEPDPGAPVGTIRIEQGATPHVVGSTAAPTPTSKPAPAPGLALAIGAVALALVLRRR